jgi:hypothetical protein
MDVTDVLRDRRGEPDGLQKMLVASVAAHIAVAALVMVAPHWGPATTEPPRTIMTISIAGGGAGPVSGGMTAIGGRPIQEQTPPAGDDCPSSGRKEANRENRGQAGAGRGARSNANTRRSGHAGQFHR